VGCQVDLHVAGEKVIRVTSPNIELNTPNQGSTCVKGRFGYDFPSIEIADQAVDEKRVEEGGRPLGVARRDGRRTPRWPVA